MKVKVISDKCIGCGNCVALTDQKVFDYNDDGLAEVVIEEVPSEYSKEVDDAISECPTSAIEEA